MPRLSALLLASLLLLVAPAVRAGSVFEGFVIRGDGVELRIGTTRHVPYSWHDPWRFRHHGWHGHDIGWGHAPAWGGYPFHPGHGRWNGHAGYDARDLWRAWRQGFEAGRRYDDGPRWYGGWSR